MQHPMLAERWLPSEEGIVLWDMSMSFPGRSQKSSLGLCRQALALHIQDGPADPGEHACSKFGSYPWSAVFGTPFGTDSLLRKEQRASHLSYKVSCSQWSRGTRLLSHDTFWVQQQHDMATFATKRLAAELTWLVHPIAQCPVQRGAVARNLWVLQSIPGTASHWPVLPVPMASKPLVS